MSMVQSSNDPQLKKQLKRSPNGGGDTAQGFYMCWVCLGVCGWNNAHYMPEIIRFMDAGLKEFIQHPPANVEISQKQVDSAFSSQPDNTISVVRTFTRISPLLAECDDLNKSVGRDHLWIFRDDVQQILASSDGFSSFALPHNLVTRLVRFHLIDNVRGEPDDWEASDVKEANFTAKLVGQSASAKHFSFHGVYAQETGDHHRGQHGALDGEFDVDLVTNKVENFRAFGTATAWGESRFTPGAPKGTFGLVTAMVSTNDDVSKVVPPEAFWGDGRYYRTPE